MQAYGRHSAREATIQSLPELRRAEAQCTRCPLYRNATQVVPGEGPSGAALMFVGEQPGDQEDRQGRPFVGPAGRIFDSALDAAGIDRQQVFVTNAVKHFKHELRGKRRMHQRPNAGEIDKCRWWLENELRLIGPELIVALGATAARAVTGRTMTIARHRGEIEAGVDGLKYLITIHPSYLLRIPEPERKAQEFGRFVADLVVARKVLP
jgi:DNA polymerase